MNTNDKQRKPKVGMLLIASPRFKNLYGPKRGTYGERKDKAVREIKATLDFLDIVDPGIVYERFVIDTLDLAIPFDSLVIEPCNGVVNCGYSKEDMKVRRVPCLLIVPASVTEGKEWVGEDFQYWIGNAQAFRIYFGDDINKIKESLEPLVKPIPI